MGWRMSNDYLRDSSAWIPLADLLDELGMSRDEFREAYPHADLDHRGLNGEVIVNRNELE